MGGDITQRLAHIEATQSEIKGMLQALVPMMTERFNSLDTELRRQADMVAGLQASVAGVEARFSNHQRL